MRLRLILVFLLLMQMHGTGFRSMRKERADRIAKTEDQQKRDSVVIRNHLGTLALIDVLYCSCCGCKMTNGTRYNYWKIKGTKEQRSSKTRVYKCQNKDRGIPHPGTGAYRADKIELIVFEIISEYVESFRKTKMWPKKLNFISSPKRRH